MAAPLWLDKLRAVPLVGLKLAPLYRSSSALIDGAQTILNKWVENDWKPTIRVESPTSVQLESNPGFQFTITHDNVLGQFTYKARIQTLPNQDPTVSLSQAPRTYSDLLRETTEKTLELFDALFHDRPRQLVRIGIVAQTTLAPDALPPGVESLIKHLGDPWVEGVEEYNVVLTPTLRRSRESLDKCHHTIMRGLKERDENYVDHVALTLDWQRVLATAMPVSRQKLEQQMAQAREDATTYFATFGIGDLNYE